MTARWALTYVLFVAVVAGVANAKPPAKPAKPAAAEPAKAEPVPAPASGSDAAPADAAPPHVNGPAVAELGHGAQINLPAGASLVEQAEAQRLLGKYSDHVDDVLGVVVPAVDDQTWHIVLRIDESGYVSDSDADELDPGELLDSYKEGTAEANKMRAAKGMSELIIDDWTEKPRYDKAGHRLAWGIAVHSSRGKSINYFTHILGRNGTLSVNLIDAADKMELAKQQAAAVLQAIQFEPGSRYTDHVESDKSSGVGLKGLVLAGVGIAVAKKTGILVAVLLFFKKGFIVVVAAVGAFFRRLFGGRKKQEMPVAPPPVDIPAATMVSSGMDAAPPAPPTGQGFEPPGGSGPPPSDPVG